MIITVCKYMLVICNEKLKTLTHAEAATFKIIAYRKQNKFLQQWDRNFEKSSAKVRTDCNRTGCYHSH